MASKAPFARKEHAVARTSRLDSVGLQLLRLPVQGADHGNSSPAGCWRPGRALGCSEGDDQELILERVRQVTLIAHEDRSHDMLEINDRWFKQDATYHMRQRGPYQRRIFHSYSLPKRKFTFGEPSIFWPSATSIGETPTSSRS